MNRLFLALVLLVAATAARADAAADNAAAEKQIRAALAGWVEAANRGDYKAALDRVGAGSDRLESRWAGRQLCARSSRRQGTIGPGQDDLRVDDQ
jgi:hypothetical protein